MKTTVARLEHCSEDRSYENEKDSLKSWFLCFCVSCNLALVTGYLVASSSVFFVALLDEFGESKEATAWVGSISNAMVAIPGPLGAYLSNRFGNRKTSIFGAILYASGVFVSSYSLNILVLCLTFSFMGGLGGGIIFNASYSAISKSFEKHRPFAFGLINFGLSIGYITLPPLSRYMIGSVGLWPTFRIISGICLLCCCFSVVYPSYPSSLNNDDTKDTLDSQLSVLRNPLFIILTGLHSFAFLGFYVPFQHLLRHAEEQGIPEEKSSLFMIYFGIASCLSRLLVSKLIDTFKHDFLALYISQASLIILGIASMVVCHTSSYHMLLGYSIVYGLMDGGFITQQCATLCRCVGPRNLPMAWGIFTLSFAMAIIFGAPIGGFLADVFKSYQPTFYFAGLTMILPGIALSIIPPYATKVQSYSYNELFQSNELLVVEKLTSV